jgi:hypothetical protein
MIVVGVFAPGAAPAVGAIARRAAAPGGHRVEVVGVMPAGASGDAALLELAAAGVGHATVTRSAAPTIEPADLDLALRYLPDIRVVILVASDAGLLEVATAASAWSAATLILIAADAEAAHAGLPEGGAIVLQAPDRDPDDAFAGFVADLARRVDDGAAAAAAWKATVAALAIDPA